MTLNQVIRQIKQIAQSHRQINSFYFGEAANWTTLKIVYPGFLLQLNGSIRIVSNGMEIDFSMFISDLVFQTEEDVNDESLEANTIEVQSDSISVINDLVALLNDPDTDWIVRGDVNCTPYDAVPINEDMVAGVKADFTLFIPTVQNTCDAPVNNIDVTDVFTLNQAVRQIKNIVLGHRQISSFYFGEAENWTKLNLRYGSVLLSLGGPVRIVKRGIEIDFELFAVDLVYKVEEDLNNDAIYGNTLEVQSDTLSIVNDIISLINKLEINWILKDGISCTPFSDVPINEDVVAGVKVSFTIYIPTVQNRCDAPVIDRNAIITEDGLEIFTENNETIVIE